MQADGLKLSVTPWPFLFLLLLGEVRQLTHTEGILIAASFHEEIVSDNLLVNFFLLF